MYHYSFPVVTKEFINCFQEIIETHVSKYASVYTCLVDGQILEHWFLSLNYFGQDLFIICLYCLLNIFFQKYYKIKICNLFGLLK